MNFKHGLLYYICRNQVLFTPTQIEAIRAGMQPGLTMASHRLVTFSQLYGTCVMFNLYIIDFIAMGG